MQQLITKPGIIRGIQTLAFALFIAVMAVRGQKSSSQNAPNIFIITINGLRWQEVFTGADSLLLKDARYVKDIGLLNQLYGGTNLYTR